MRPSLLGSGHPIFNWVGDAPLPFDSPTLGAGYGASVKRCVAFGPPWGARRPGRQPDAPFVAYSGPRCAGYLETIPGPLESGTTNRTDRACVGSTHPGGFPAGAPPRPILRIAQIRIA